MAKLYFDKSEISQYQGLNQGLLEIVEKLGPYKPLT